MTARYDQLREYVGALAAPAQEQVAYLDRLFTNCTGGGDASGYGNVELVEQISDYTLALDDMVGRGELTESEAKAVRELDRLTVEMCSQVDQHFWDREALFADHRWHELRFRAAEVVAQLPEKRDPGSSPG